MKIPSNTIVATNNICQEAGLLVGGARIKELKMALTELVGGLKMSPSTVSYAADRGGVITTDHKYQLEDY